MKIYGSLLVWLKEIFADSRLSEFLGGGRVVCAMSKGPSLKVQTAECFQCFSARLKDPPNFIGADMEYYNYDYDKKTKKSKKTKKQLAEEKEKKAIEAHKKELREVFGSFIAQARKASGMSIEEMAEMMHIKPEDLEEIEKGEGDMPILEM